MAALWVSAYVLAGAGSAYCWWRFGWMDGLGAGEEIELGPFVCLGAIWPVAWIALLLNAAEQMRSPTLPTRAAWEVRRREKALQAERPSEVVPCDGETR